jgi:hypothetical protein
MKDNLGGAAVAKVASQVSEFYDTVLQMSNSPVISGVIPKVP